MIGIIPAAGKATRLHGLPKFLLPIPGGFLLDTLYKRMEQAGTNRVAIGTSPECTDLLRRIAGDYSVIYTVNTDTMSETVIEARERFGTSDYILFGMPDSYWTADSVYQRLVTDLDNGAMVSAALFETEPEQRHKLGMCDVALDEGDLLITRVVDKPEQTTLHLAWGAMAWRRDFWRYIEPSDPHVGYALQRAVEAKERVFGSLIYGRYWDCGTPDEYFDCINHLSGQAVQA